MSGEPLVPDHVPPEWLSEIVRGALAQAWENLRPVMESLGGERVRYLVLPEYMYDAIRGELDDDSEWWCPDGYPVLVVYSDE